MDSKQQCLLLLFALVMATQTQQLCAQQFDYPTAKPPALWVNGPNIPHTVSYPDGTTIKAHFLRRDRSAPLGPSFAAGFYCRGSGTPTGPPCRSNFVFGIFKVSTNSAGGIVINGVTPQLEWFIKWGRPFGENATLRLTTNGELFLNEADGTPIWFTESKSVIRELTLFPDGSLRMLNPSGATVWTSFNVRGGVLTAPPFDYPSATAPALWINGPNIPHTVTYPDGTTIKALLLRRNPSAPLGPAFAAGFFCQGSGTPTSTPCRSNFVFGVFTVFTNSAGGIVINGITPKLVWFAKWGRPFGENATLRLTTNGEMFLNDADGSGIWFTESKSVIKELTLFPDGSLRMINPSGVSVWSSSNFQGNVLVRGQEDEYGMVNFFM